MKIRQGFVSNSSSSSFCIYGTSIEDGEYGDFYDYEDGEENSGGKNPIEWLKEIRSRDSELYTKRINEKINKCKATIEERGGHDNWWQKKLEIAELLLKLDDINEEQALLIVEEYGSEMAYTIGHELFRLSVNSTPWGETFIGLDWSSVKDDETGTQFKERAQKLVALVFGKTHKLGTCEHAWRDG